MQKITIIKNKRNILAFLLVLLSIFLIIYQFNYSVSAKIKKNLKDFSKVETFVGQNVNDLDIRRFAKDDNSYSFTILNSKIVPSFKKIGKIFMYDKEENLINDFILFTDGEKYMIYMRGIYMVLD